MYSIPLQRGGRRHCNGRLLGRKQPVANAPVDVWSSALWSAPHKAERETTTIVAGKSATWGAGDVQLTAARNGRMAEDGRFRQFEHVSRYLSFAKIGSPVRMTAVAEPETSAVAAGTSATPVEPTFE